MAGYFDGLDNTQVANLTTAQISALTASDFEGLRTDQVSYLSTASVAVLTTAVSNFGITLAVV